MRNKAYLLFFGGGGEKAGLAIEKLWPLEVKKKMECCTLRKKSGIYEVPQEVLTNTGCHQVKNIEWLLIEFSINVLMLISEKFSKVVVINQFERKTPHNGLGWVAAAYKLTSKLASVLQTNCLVCYIQTESVLQTTIQRSKIIS